jgi:hypothetical protein
MAKQTSNPVKTVASIAGILLAFVIILRIALAPLYMKMEQMARMENRDSASESSGGGDGGGGGENININLGGVGGLFNWALGWAWGGPGWYRGPDYGWWGANVWNGWRNWWGGGGHNNRVWNGNVNETFNRDVNNEFRGDDAHSGGGEHFHGGGGHESHGGGGHESHGGGHGGRR